MEITKTSPAMILSDIQPYPLQEMDLLILVRLNPLKTDLSSITTEQAKSICTQLEAENDRLQLLIKSQVFGMNTESEIELLVRRYHSSLVILLDHSIEVQKSTSAKTAIVKNLYKCMLGSLDNLLTFIETRFPEFLGLEMRAPATYLAVSQKELRQRADKLKLKLQRHTIKDEAIDILSNSLDRFVNYPKPNNKLTFRTVLYHKELVYELEKLNCDGNPSGDFSKIDELLIYMNFNSKAFVRHFINSTLQKMGESKTLIEKIDKLLYYRKAFYRIHPKPGMIYNPQFPAVEKVIGKWFAEEISYLEKKLQWAMPLDDSPAKETKPAIQAEAAIRKVLVNLSSDQTGLILRAADELRILIAKSLSEVFKTIVPNLATPHREHLSYKGMRTQSYVAEERDKDIAIDALERMIKKIREY